MRKPFFKKTHKAWYVWHNGKPFRLAANKEEAFRKWAELQTAPVTTSLPVVQLLDRFLDRVHSNRSPRTWIRPRSDAR